MGVNQVIKLKQLLTEKKELDAKIIVSAVEKYIGGV